MGGGADDENRKKLRQKIRAKRAQRVGIDDPSPSSSQRPETVSRSELSAHVERELRGMFGNDPAVANMIQELAKDPLSLLQSDASVSAATPQERAATEGLVKLCAEVDDDEAPPSQ